MLLRMFRTLVISVALSCAALGQASPKVPARFDTCTFPDGLMIVAEDELPAANTTRSVNTASGRKQIEMLTGKRIGFAYPDTDFFANVKVEILPAPSWATEKADLKASLDYLAASSPGVMPSPKSGTTINGWEFSGIERTKLEGGVVGSYLLFNDATQTVVTVYLLNQDPDRRKYQSLDEFKSLRDSFLATYTRCVAP
jgi:hypothetical protein